MAPLWDICKGQFVGVLSALDFVLILREVCVIYFILILVEDLKFKITISLYRYVTE